MATPERSEGRGAIPRPRGSGVASLSIPTHSRDQKKRSFFWDSRTSLVLPGPAVVVQYVNG